MAIPSAKDRQHVVAAYLRLEPSIKTTNGKALLEPAISLVEHIVSCNRLSEEVTEEMQRPVDRFG